MTVGGYCPNCRQADYEVNGYLCDCLSCGVIWDPSNPARIVSDAEYASVAINAAAALDDECPGHPPVDGVPVYCSGSCRL